MFKVVRRFSKDIETVYAVQEKEYMGSVDTKFLIFSYGWTWVSSENYEPYEE